MKYHLEKYRSPANRYECPQCHDKHSFTRYICDETGQQVSTIVGKCDHISSCGYHYTPSQFRRDYPWEGAEPSLAPTIRPKVKVEKPDPVYLPDQYVEQSLTTGHSNFTRWLYSILPAASVADAIRNYRIGATTPNRYKNVGTIFWQIDRFSRVHDGKIMWYRPDGHREKTMTWVSSTAKKAGLYPDQQTEKCLFGEHLLEDPILSSLPVCLVESEKSAIVCSCLYPECLWLATCGCSGLNRDKLRPLFGRPILVFPDAGEYDKWDEILSTTSHQYTIVDYIESYPPNTDLVDILLDIRDSGVSLINESITKFTNK